MHAPLWLESSAGSHIATGLGFHLACVASFWSAAATEGWPAHSTSQGQALHLRISYVSVMLP